MNRPTITLIATVALGLVSVSLLCIALPGALQLSAVPMPFRVFAVYPIAVCLAAVLPVIGMAGLHQKRLARAYAWVRGR